MSDVRWVECRGGGGERWNWMPRVGMNDLTTLGPTVVREPGCFCPEVAKEGVGGVSGASRAEQSKTCGRRRLAALGA